MSGPMLRALLVRIVIHCIEFYDDLDLCNFDVIQPGHGSFANHDFLRFLVMLVLKI